MAIGSEAQALEIRLDGPVDGEPGWIAMLRGELRRAGDPEGAARRAESVLRALPEDRLRDLAARRPVELTRVLAATCGTAPFLAARLRRHPDWLVELVEDDLAVPRAREALEARLERDLARAGLADGAAERALREIKYFELARLSVRDACDAWVPLAESGVTLREISQLADVVLEGALRVAAARLEARVGPPRWRTADGRERRLGFCVLGLGKLGSEELNYSSDVDLVYVHEAPRERLGGGPSDLEPIEYFTRLARSLGPMLTETTDDGFLYRVDLDLRPEGSRGLLVVSDENLFEYYETSADTWEKATFMKARPVAGDLAFGWRAIRAVHPTIYRSAMDFAAVEGIRELKQKIASARGASGDAFDVKLDSGGIRDVEFVAQAMQLLHGGRIPQLRERSTQRALEGLAQVDLLPVEVVGELLAAYRFLRRVENRLQMEAERQVHVVPADPGARTRLARSMGGSGEDALETFDAALAGHRRRVIERFRAFLGGDDAERVEEIFARNAPRLMAFPTTRRMLEQIAGQFARAIESSPDREMALNNLDRFIGGLAGRTFYYELLMDRPELVPRLAALFGASRFLSDVLARHPRLIEPLFDNPERLLLDRDELRADLTALRRELDPDGSGDPEVRLCALRRFVHRQTANVGLLDVADRITRDDAERALADVADVCVEDALDFAREQLARRAAELPPAARDARFLVVGMGKLGSREMGYGSDLDLIFLYDLDASGPADLPTAQDHFVRLAQRLISALQTTTADGSCYEIDARMRPSGNQGSLVTSLEAFRRYHDGEAATWERQALLRARPVAGDERLAADFEALRREILSRPLGPDAIAEIDHVRRRMETELAREGRGRRDFKTGRGGVLDVENVVQFLQLRGGGEHPDLLQPMSTARALSRLGELGLLDAERFAALRDGWEFLRRLSNGLRVVENRSISDLDEERGDLDGLARRLGYRSERRASEGRQALLRDYRRHTEAIRRVYEAFFRSGDAPASR